MEFENLPRSSDDRDRIARLERSVRWVKIALVVLILCAVFPAVAGAASAVFFVVGVGGGAVAFIVLVMCLLEWWFGGGPGKA
ncbi:MAG: hypothetical protein WD875_15320 [Pirellulales bacterium]